MLSSRSSIASFAAMALAGSSQLAASMLSRAPLAAAPPRSLPRPRREPGTLRAGATEFDRQRLAAAEDRRAWRNARRLERAARS